jgi:hypothetical protein
MGGFYILMAEFMKGQANYQPVVGLFFTIMGVVFGLFSIMVGALAIIGGVFAVKRKHWAVAIAGAIAGAVLFFPCGIAGTILVSLGRAEFSALEGLQQSQTTG